MKYFIANWKANKNLKEAWQWIKAFLKNYQSSNQIKIIICPPVHLIYPLHKKIKKIKNIFLGSQNISPFDNGSFTGEITARMLKDIVKYSLIGHSERRKYFLETEGDIEKKIFQAQKYHIEPILCVRDEKDKIFPSVKFVAYEPISAIGTGFNQSPEKVLEIKKKLNLNPTTIFIYGGSVNEENVKKYLASNQIKGLLIGSASLNPIQFSYIVNLNLKK